MKFKDYLKEQEEVSLIGRKLEGGFVTAHTQYETWVGDFRCNNKQLTTLKGGPKEVTGFFNCSVNHLTSLEGAPQKIGGRLWCFNNRLTTLKGAPKIINGEFHCANNLLTSLEYAPSHIGDDFSCTFNNITNFKDIHKTIIEITGGFYCNDNPIKSHVLGLLLIKGITKIVAGDDPEHDNSWGKDNNWCNILNRYIGKGRAGLIECQNELIEAGYEEYAQL